MQMYKKKKHIKEIIELSGSELKRSAFSATLMRNLIIKGNAPGLPLSEKAFSCA